ncbi:MAG TPA: ABC transporter permease [Firmicutes bacterium]|jgi:simple sugar transport system permease protein|nr:ABC transporter permease [Bacillota bacterium]
MGEVLGLLFNTAVFAAALRMATPLIFAALGGIFSERSGVVNIALEGMMLIGAFTAMFVSNQTGNPWLGVIGAMAAGVLIGLLHALFCIHYRANQVVIGTAINIFAGGLTVFLLRYFFGAAGTSPSVATIGDVTIPVINRIPWIGRVIGRQNPLVYLALLAVVLAHLVIYKTSWGLRLRAVGEHPKAADTVGVNVFRMRYVAVALSGALAGLGGTYLSIAHLSRFSEGMTAGRGFIALAAVIFGKWTPFGALGACLFFGYADALQMRLQDVGIPTQFMNMLPYVLTMVALAGFIGKSVGPKASGQPYIKG